ncbi:hypothetical protein [Chitinophaga sp. Cy-1792]|uniref:hypothetical protein n=1 Tax=Chitinophaga sp. Cy-1792 TaxID=2608339 RepID=UPI0014221B16|nr:hypothetical protein [Chitinophaga sp. Cy-1792]NIG55828.1 hypothetical protein [Chitinophaga sp. Cy-1792]
MKSLVITDVKLQYLMFFSLPQPIILVMINNSQIPVFGSDSTDNVNYSPEEKLQDLKIEEVSKVTEGVWLWMR